MSKLRNISNKTEIQNGWYIYFEDYFSKEEAQSLYQIFLQELNWEESEIKIFGKTYQTPRLEAFYSENGQHYSYSGKKLKINSFTSSLLSLKVKLEQDFGFEFNSVLANLYRDGKDSNGWHSDNEKELGKNPVIASLSFGSERRFDFKHILTKEKLAFNLQEGSLLIMGGEMQHYWKHQIAKSTKVYAPRINLTFRKII
jgi:alkylated DNA repair dioxygenase AlkB